MNRTEFIGFCANKLNITKKNAAEIIDSMVDCISDVLASGEDISILNFGTIGTRQKNARVGRNPKTKEEFEIPAQKSVYFKAGKGLKELVNKK